MPKMARLSIFLTHVLSLAGSAVGRATTMTTINSRPQQQQQQLTNCAHVEAPTSLTWLLQDQPFEQEDPSAFFYVNQDIDATGRKANSVAQLVTFGAPLKRETTNCQLLFVMPEDSESWELIQREGAAELRVFRVPTNPSSDDAVRQKRDLLSDVKVRPGTQSIDLGRCDGSGSFVFELANAGRSRVAFRQASKPNGGFGVFIGNACPDDHDRRSGPEDL